MGQCCAGEVLPEGTMCSGGCGWTWANQRNAWYNHRAPYPERLRPRTATAPPAEGVPAAADPNMCDVCAERMRYSMSAPPFYADATAGAPKPAAAAAAAAASSPFVGGVARLIDPATTRFDTRRETFERIFAPNPVPEGFAPGAHLLDCDAGLEAVVLGCLPMPQNEAAAVLFLDVSNYIGVVPYITDWHFIKRWRVMTPSALLAEGTMFVVPNFSGKHPDDVIDPSEGSSDGAATAEQRKNEDEDDSSLSAAFASSPLDITGDKLHLTGFISPLPIDIFCLTTVLGLRFGTVLTSLDDFNGLSSSAAAAAAATAAAVATADSGSPDAAALSDAQRALSDTSFSFGKPLQPDILLAEPGPRQTTASCQIQRGRDYFVVGLHFAEETGAVQLILRDCVSHNLVSPAPGTSFSVGKRQREALLAIAAFRSRVPVVPHIPSPSKTKLLYCASAADYGSVSAANGGALDAPSLSSTPSSLSVIKADPIEFPTVRPENLVALANIRRHGDARSAQERERALSLLMSSGDDAGLGKMIRKREVAERVLAAIEALVAEEVPLTAWVPTLRRVTLAAPYRPGMAVPLIEAMMRDVFYQNMFVTRHGTGSTDMDARKGWEEQLSHGAYTAALTGTWRPRYGAINLTGAPGGRMIKNNRYGDIFLVVGGLRDYVSVSSLDSSVQGTEVTGLRGAHKAAFLASLPDNLIVELAKIVQAGVEYVPAKVDYNYSECQIHARPNLARHISHVVIPDSYAADTSPQSLGRLFAIMNFCLKNACWLVTTSTLANIVEMRCWPEAQLQRFMEAHGAMIYVKAALGFKMGGDQAPCLVEGGSSKRQRELLDAIVDYFCVVEMARLNGVLYAEMRKNHQQQQQQQQQPQQAPGQKK